MSSSRAVNACGMKLSFSELGLATPEELRVEPGRGDEGISHDGDEDNDGALKGCVNVTLGRRGSVAASFKREREVWLGLRMWPYGVVIWFGGVEGPVPIYGALRSVVRGEDERFCPGCGNVWKEDKEPYACDCSMP